MSTILPVPVLADAETCPQGEDTAGEARESTKEATGQYPDSRGGQNTLNQQKGNQP